MASEELIALIALTRLEGIGGKLCRRLRAQWGSLTTFWTEKRLPGPLAEVERPALRLQAETILQDCERLGIEIIPFWSERYPYLLSHGMAPPPILYRKGTLDDLARPCVAVVGTRKPTAYGLKVTQDFVAALVGAGICIVSGLAYGIDAEAHRLALQEGGYTIAVLAHGLDIVYPSLHKRLAEEIMARGSLLSEYPPGEKLYPRRFPHRNRIIAGLSHLTLVVQSAEKSGALSTAQAAFAVDRPVYAVPGDIYAPQSQGVHQLIYQQIAQIAFSPAVLLRELKSLPLRLPHVPRQTAEAPFADPTDQALYRLLQRGPMLIDDLAAGVRRPVQEVVQRIVLWEIEGWVVQEPGGRVRLAKTPDARA